MDAGARALAPGSPVRLVASDRAALGVAMFNPHSLICARLVSRRPDDRLDSGLLTSRLARALTLRARLFDRPHYRWVHAEADGLPGLVIDRYGDVVVVQANSAGLDRVIEDVVGAVRALVDPAAIVLRNDSAARGLEGLASEVRVAWGTVDGPVPLEEDGVRLFADPIDGQKTGWFFDQRANRAAAARLVARVGEGCRVLDLYGYAGGFGVRCAVAGASAVTIVDRSEAALALAARAADANGVSDRVEVRRADVFQLLDRAASAGERYQIVVADPPAFARSKKDVGPGLRAYRKLARLSARVTAPGGFLVIASCSHTITVEAFAEQVARGVADAGRGARVLISAGADLDHPVHPFLPESAYLKAQILSIDDDGVP